MMAPCHLDGQSLVEDGEGHARVDVGIHTVRGFAGTVGEINGRCGSSDIRKTT